MELFDIVDADDRVIGSESRSVVHRRGLMHRAVHILVLNSLGQIFLQKRAQTKDRFPGAWDSSTAGHLESGENYDAAALRELNEELGIRPDPPLEKLFKVNASSQTGQEFIWTYRLQHEGPFTMPASEIERGQWFSSDEISDWVERRPGDFTDCFILIWKLYCRHAGLSVGNT